MENHDLSVYREKYYLIGFNKEDESIELNQDDYNLIVQGLSDKDVRFIKIKNRIINVSSIKEVVIVPQKPNTVIYAETGTNPYYREWCMTEKKLCFKDWLNNNLERNL